MFLMLLVSNAALAQENCVDCHKENSPGQVQDWAISKHAANDVTCSTCHGEEHQTAADYKKAQLPDESVCAECHEEQVAQFSSGKHALAWAAMKAMPRCEQIVNPTAQI